MASITGFAPPVRADIPPISEADRKRIAFFGLHVEAPAPAPPAVQLAPPADEDLDDDGPAWTWESWTDQDTWELGPERSDLDLGEFASPPMAADDEAACGVVVPPKPATVRLSICGFVYQVEPIDVGEFGTVGFKVHKLDTGNHYSIVRDHYGLVRCDCGDYQFRHDGTANLCKHGHALVERGLIPAPAPTHSAVGRREMITPHVSVARDNFPETTSRTAPSPLPRPRRFTPSPDEMAEAAQLFGDLEAERVVYRRELAAQL
jgi:hypothetical protein